MEIFNCGMRLKDLTCSILMLYVCISVDDIQSFTKKSYNLKYKQTPANTFMLNHILQIEHIVVKC